MRRSGIRSDAQIAFNADPRSLWAMQAAGSARRTLSMLFDATLFAAALLLVAYVAFVQL
ncbi:MAG: hypothetical protein AB7U38_12885 [Hyphomicrobiales bacterium]